MKNLFGFEGRIGRLNYFLVFLFTVIVRVVIFVLNPDSAIGSILGLAIFVGCIWLYICAIVKRFHDLNKSGENFWFLLIPLYNVYLALGMLLFRQGTVGVNDYGNNPVGNNSSPVAREAKSVSVSGTKTEHKGLSTGAIWGIIVGIFVLAIVLHFMFDAPN
jgi:uncharacterized membrane protein YhaH (DUF805 family)